MNGECAKQQNNVYVNFLKVRLGNPENDPVEIEPENEACTSNVSKSVARDNSGALRSEPRR
jgi:hypothetical protein